jgi:catechol 2,3-dioxygenase-like lactoylglutathione lyase family enzyme
VEDTVITAVHAIIYATDPDATRTFLRETLGLPWVEGGGPGESWPIFALPPAEVGVHPHDHPEHELYLMCDDIQATVAELREKGVEFEGEVADRGWGLLATIRLPGAGKIGLYEPRHAVAYQAAPAQGA